MTTLRKPPKPKRRFVNPGRGMFILTPLNIEKRAPGDLCGGRILKGAEFRARKAELEAREAKERALIHEAWP